MSQYNENRSPLQNIADAIDALDSADNGMTTPRNLALRNAKVEALNALRVFSDSYLEFMIEDAIRAKEGIEDAEKNGHDPECNEDFPDDPRCIEEHESVKETD